MCLEKEICKKFKEILGKYDLTKDLVGCIDVAKVKRFGDYIDLPDEFWNKLFEKKFSPPPGVPIDCSFNSENTKYFSQIQENSNKKRKYVELRFDNDYPLFKMKIEEVIVDQTVSQNDFDEFKKYAKNIKCSYK